MNRRKIGIGILLILNLVFVCLIVAVEHVSYHIITGNVGKIHATTFTQEITNEILKRVLYISAFFAAINYWILKTLIYSKRSFITTLILTFSGIVLFLPFLLTARQSFLKRQSQPDYFNHYYDRFAIKKAIIITSTDTIQIKELNEFTDRLWADHVGPLKYQKTIKLVFVNNNGTSDTIPTNGQIFGPFKGHYFKADENIIDDYLRRHN